MEYQIYIVRRGKFKGQRRIRLVADNGETIVPPESYHNLADAEHVIDLIKNSQSAPVVTVER